MKKFDPCGKCPAFCSTCWSCVVAAMFKAGMLDAPHAGGTK